MTLRNPTIADRPVRYAGRRRSALLMTACALALGLGLAPFHLDPATGKLSINAAFAKDGGAKGNGSKSEGKGSKSEGKGGKKSGGSKSSSNGSAGDSGSSSSNGGAGGSAGSSGKSNNAGSGSEQSDAADVEAGLASQANQSAVNSAREQLQKALRELAAARTAYDRASQSGDEVSTAIAKGRLARAELGLSSAKMSVVVAEAGYAASQ